MFTTGDVSWQVVDEQLARDERALPRADGRARFRRDRGPAEPRAGACRGQTRGAARRRRRLSSSEPRRPGWSLSSSRWSREAPDWAEAAEYIDALILEEIEDDLLEQCGVNPAQDPRETWLETVQDRLREDLSGFRDDIEGDHDEIEEWEFRDGRIFASIGSFEDESNPDSGHGWLCRLLDAGALARPRASGGFARRKVLLP